jgi:hypothetical protein
MEYNVRNKCVRLTTTTLRGSREYNTVNSDCFNIYRLLHGHVHIMPDIIPSVLGCYLFSRDDIMLDVKITMS